MSEETQLELEIIALKQRIVDLEILVTRLAHGGTWKWGSMTHQAQERVAGRVQELNNARSLAANTK